MGVGEIAIVGIFWKLRIPCILHVVAGHPLCREAALHPCMRTLQQRMPLRGVHPGGHTTRLRLTASRRSTDVTIYSTECSTS